ncbi:MAG: carbon storage regulator [Myxococcota bacterium]|jgi:carbon storage regulator CsrA
MLVITQKEGEGLAIGEDVKILIKWVHGNKVRFCIKAPRDVLLRRSAEGFPEFEHQSESPPDDSSAP